MYVSQHYFNENFMAVKPESITMLPSKSQMKYSKTKKPNTQTPKQNSEVSFSKNSCIHTYIL